MTARVIDAILIILHSWGFDMVTYDHVYHTWELVTGYNDGNPKIAAIRYLRDICSHDELSSIMLGVDKESRFAAAFVRNFEQKKLNLCDAKAIVEILRNCPRED